MSLLLPAFRPDLRHPGVEVPPSDSPWAQWNKFSVIELACRKTFDFFHSRLAPRSRIVDIGCGNGYLSLELAREGHDVVGLDESEEAIAIAKNALAENSDEILGSLEHVALDFWKWEPSVAFDAILFNRSLHHIDRLDEVVRRSRSLLKPGGKILLSDFAADGIDEKWKTWVQADLAGHGHDLGDMIAALHDAFTQTHFSVEPYLFSVRANREWTDDWQVTKRFYDEEKDLLLRRDYKPVGFRWVGIKR